MYRMDYLLMDGTLFRINCYNDKDEITEIWARSVIVSSNTISIKISCSTWEDQQEKLQIARNVFEKSLAPLSCVAFYSPYDNIPVGTVFVLENEEIVPSNYKLKCQPVDGVTTYIKTRDFQVWYDPSISGARVRTVGVHSIRGM